MLDLFIIVNYLESIPADNSRVLCLDQESAERVSGRVPGSLQSAECCQSDSGNSWPSGQDEWPAAGGQFVSKREGLQDHSRECRGVRSTPVTGETWVDYAITVISYSYCNSCTCLRPLKVKTNSQLSQNTQDIDVIISGAQKCTVVYIAYVQPCKKIKSQKH